MTKILEFLASLLKLIPIIDRWFRKSASEKEQERRAEVDNEHQGNRKDGRPSGDFWKGRGV